MKTKKMLRINTLKKLSNLTIREKEIIEQAMYDILYQTSIWQTATTIGITYSQENEWSTIPIMQKAWEAGKVVTIPKVDPQSKAMTFYQINHTDDVERGAYDIYEPKANLLAIDKSTIDLLFVPGLVFDKEGYRIGYGGGYYDRFLVGYPHQTVSLVSKLQIIDKLPHEIHDIPVQRYIMEDSFHDL